MESGYQSLNANCIQSNFGVCRNLLANKVTFHVIV